ncbi:hypothetical protein [Cupriavidus pauculus]|uniref:hypothetical protein n=1 Tax=Cupriavidus pauculus TaxID=82633 RepID=UPI001D0CC434|nr:hypothetical protein [Cupriavidus pauculus]
MRSLKALDAHFWRLFALLALVYFSWGAFRAVGASWRTFSGSDAWIATVFATFLVFVAVLAGYEFARDRLEQQDQRITELEALRNSHGDPVCVPASVLAPVPVAVPERPNVDGISKAEVDALVGLVECGPLDDGEVPSPSVRDSLLARGLAVRVVVKGADGYTAANYAGRDVYTKCFGGTTLAQAMRNRQIMLAEQARA